MSGIEHGTKVTPLFYIFKGVETIFPLPDVDEDEMGNALSSARAKLVKEILAEQKLIRKTTGALEDAYILFLGNVYVVRATNAKCEKIVGDMARKVKAKYNLFGF